MKRLFENIYTLKKMLGCFNTNLPQIWTNPNVGLKMRLKKSQLKVKVEVWLKFEITFLTQIWVQTTQHCLVYDMIYENVYI